MMLWLGVALPLGYLGIEVHALFFAISLALGAGLLIAFMRVRCPRCGHPATKRRFPSWESPWPFARCPQCGLPAEANWPLETRLDLSS